MLLWVIFSIFFVSIWFCCIFFLFLLFFCLVFALPDKISWDNSPKRRHLTLLACSVHCQCVHTILQTNIYCQFFYAILQTNIFIANFSVILQTNIYCQFFMPSCRPILLRLGKAISIVTQPKSPLPLPLPLPLAINSDRSLKKILCVSLIGN